MPNQRQIVAILTLAGSFVALGFAIYNLWVAFQPNMTLNSLQAKAKAEAH